MAKKKGKGGGKDDKGRGKGKGKGKGDGKGKDVCVDMQPDVVKPEVRIMSPAAVEDLQVVFRDLGMGMIVADVSARVMLNPLFETPSGVPKVLVTGGLANLDIALENPAGNVWSKTGIGPGTFQRGVTYFFQVVAAYDVHIRDLKTSKSATVAVP